jgi:hypothetical protein
MDKKIPMTVLRSYAKSVKKKMEGKKGSPSKEQNLFVRQIKMGMDLDLTDRQYKDVAKFALGSLKGTATSAFMEYADTAPIKPSFLRGK